MGGSGVGEIRHLTDFQRSLSLDRIYVKGKVPVPQSGFDRGNIRILSWNMEHGRNPAQIAETIAVAGPDIACLQEVDWGNERTGSVDVCWQRAPQPKNRRLRSRWETCVAHVRQGCPT
jgi:hypothetical protein